MIPLQPGLPSQTVQQPAAQPVRLLLRSRATAEAEQLFLENIPRRAADLLLHITSNDIFTPEQKAFANSWEGHFIQLLNHPNQMLPAKAVCFLGMKVITPAIVAYVDNRLASDQLIPVMRAQRELLTLVLPENIDVEGFIIQCEDVHSLMLETKEKLNDIIAMNQETERMLLQSANGMRDQILANANQSRVMLRTLAQQWQQKIRLINEKLTQLNEKSDEFNQKLQKHSHELETTGKQLAVEQQVFLGLVEDLKNILGKV